MRKAMVERGGPLSVRRQCELLGVNRNRLADPVPGGMGEAEQEMARRIDEVHLRFPEFGTRRMSRWLLREGIEGATRRRVAQVMKAMGLAAVYRRPRTSPRAPGAQIYPYLLRDRKVESADEAWCADVTYIPMARGFAYLVAVMDWKTRAVLSWKLSNTLDGTFCVEALREALEAAGRAPEIFNTDQGCQFTSRAWIATVQEKGAKVSCTNWKWPWRSGFRITTIGSSTGAWGIKPLGNATGPNKRRLGKRRHDTEDPPGSLPPSLC
jgi:putative transposase